MHFDCFVIEVYMYNLPIKKTNIRVPWAIVEFHDTTHISQPIEEVQRYTHTHFYSLMKTHQTHDVEEIIKNDHYNQSKMTDLMLEITIVSFPSKTHIWSSRYYVQNTCIVSTKDISRLNKVDSRKKYSSNNKITRTIACSSS